MKKNIMKVALVAVVGLVAGINMLNAQKSDTLSDIAMANVEALAYNEGASIGDQQCYQVYTPADWFHADQVFVDCYTCTQKKGRNFDVSRFCTKPVY